MTMPELTIILVAPQMGENIGAVARAMGNFGLSDLRIVNPRDGWPNKSAQAMAAHALPIIESAKIYGATKEAIADCQYIAAATARQRDMQKQHLTPKELISQKPHGKTAILFGQENNGLSNEDITLANAIISIPVSADCPSINLAQSSAILCYEWFQAQGTSLNYESEPPAPQSELQGFYDNLENRLDDTGFWQVGDKKPKMWRNLRNIFTRAQPTSQEVRSLQGMIKSLNKRK